MPSPPTPTRGVWSKLPVFKGLEEGFYRKLVVLRSLEAKFMKTKNLLGLVRDMEPRTAPEVHS